MPNDYAVARKARKVVEAVLGGPSESYEGREAAYTDHPMAWTLNRTKQDSANMARKMADRQNSQWDHDAE